MTGTDLKAWRQRVGLTQQQLADRIGYERTIIWRWESSDRPVPPWMELALRTIEHDLANRTTPEPTPEGE